MNSMHVKIAAVGVAIVLAVIAFKLWWPPTIGFWAALHLAHRVLLASMVAIKAGKFMLMLGAGLIVAAGWLWAKLAKRQSAS
jgi:hypothetical protein